MLHIIEDYKGQYAIIIELQIGCKKQERIQVQKNQSSKKVCETSKIG